MTDPNRKLAPVPPATPVRPIPPPTARRQANPEPWTTLTFQIRFGSVPRDLLWAGCAERFGDRELIGWWIVGADPGDFDEFPPYQLEPYRDDTSWEFRRDQFQRFAAGHFETVLSRKLGKTVEVTGWTGDMTGTNPAGDGVERYVCYNAKAVESVHRIEFRYAGSERYRIFEGLTMAQATSILSAFEYGAATVKEPKPKLLTSVGKSAEIHRYVNLRHVEEIEYEIERHDLNLSRIV